MGADVGAFAEVAGKAVAPPKPKEWEAPVPYHCKTIKCLAFAGNTRVQIKWRKKDWLDTRRWGPVWCNDQMALTSSMPGKGVPLYANTLTYLESKHDERARCHHPTASAEPWRHEVPHIRRGGHFGQSPRKGVPTPKTQIKKKKQARPTILVHALEMHIESTLVLDKRLILGLVPCDPGQLGNVVSVVHVQVAGQDTPEDMLEGRHTCTVDGPAMNSRSNWMPVVENWLCWSNDAELSRQMSQPLACSRGKVVLVSVQETRAIPDLLVRTDHSVASEEGDRRLSQQSPQLMGRKPVRLPDLSAELTSNELWCNFMFKLHPFTVSPSAFKGSVINPYPNCAMGDLVE
ncbi:hypothetical protein DFH07DRAFT_786058 [Mycena maculata]|uniref:Uncharacterized protein n=1 Tax=Mycena maculata TaxID=230809 RepID=A0AAD7H4B4_9AGAR|nr:hypothetical protein DFH07DRAFT_786058 [Mycena maculata]